MEVKGGGGGEEQVQHTPAYLVEYTGRGFGCQVAGTGALRLAVALRLALHMFRRVLVEEEGGWWSRGHPGTARVEEPRDEKFGTLRVEPRWIRERPDKGEHRSWDITGFVGLINGYQEIEPWTKGQSWDMDCRVRTPLDLELEP